MFEARRAAVARLAALLPPPRCSSPVLERAVGLPPGPEAMRALVGVDPRGLDEDDRVEHLLAWERCARWVEAQRARAVVAVAGPAPAEGGPGAGAGRAAAGGVGRAGTRGDLLPAREDPRGRDDDLG